MTPLAEHQFEILPSQDAESGFVFGIGATVSCDGDGFDTGEATWLTQDGQNTRRGTTGFGRDVLGPRAWTWSSHVNQEDVETAVDTLDEFADAWAPDLLAQNPGQQTALRYRIANRYRRVFGRPRRFAAPPNNLILNGFVPVTHDFQLVDNFTYDDTESNVQILYASSASGGGFVLPAAMPISTMSSDGNGNGQLDVTGTARAYPIIRFNGPWTNPVLTTDNWKIRWTGAIPIGGWVEIDTRPWALTVLNHNGGSAVSGLDRRLYLEDLYFAPKTRPQITLGGSAPGGGASAIIRWRNTWKSL